MAYFSPLLFIFFIYLIHKKIKRQIILIYIFFPKILIGQKLKTYEEKFKKLYNTLLWRCIHLKLHRNYLSQICDKKNLFAGIACPPITILNPIKDSSISKHPRHRVQSSSKVKIVKHHLAI